MEDIDKKTEFLNYIIPILEDIIENDFNANEKKYWVKSLKYLKTDIYNLFSIYFFYDENNLDSQNIINNPNLFFSNKKEAEPLASELFKNVKTDKKMLNNFNSLLYKINIIYQSKINIEFQDTIHEEVISKFQSKTILLGQRYCFPKELVDTNYPSIRTFFPNEKCIFNFTNLRLELQKNNYLNTDIDVESFKMIFSQERINSKFNKISWLGSIFELKFLINELYEKEVLLDELNYYYTIMDCFLNDDKEIDFNQLKSPKGSKKNFDLIKNIISNCIKKK